MAHGVRLEPGRRARPRGPSSAPPPAVTPPRHHFFRHGRRRAVVHVTRWHGLVVVKGRAPRRTVARLLVFRRNGRTGGFARRASYRWRFVVRRSGHFRLRLHGHALRRGAWRIVVRPTAGAHWVKAAAVLGG